MAFPVAPDNELPALGRPLHLGMLYDRRCDTFVPGVTLWDLETLQSHLHRTPQPRTEFQVLASDNYDQLASALHVTLPLRASLLGGRVDLNGSARCLKDTKKSENQVRVVLHASITTRFEELTMTHLRPQNVAHPGVFDQGEATHVVTAVLYGAQAFFVFDREVASAENKDNIERELRSRLQSFCNRVHAGGETTGGPQKDKTSTESFKCTFYGDVTLDSNPITDPDAMRIYADLPKLLGEKGERAVPVKVWLYPLAKLDRRAAQLVREISADLVTRVQSAVEQLSDCEGQCRDLLDAWDLSLPPLCLKVRRFQDLCQRYRDTFQERVAHLLPSIRGGGQEEGALRDLLAGKELSPFRPKWLSEFLGKKSAEMDCVKLFCTRLRGIDVIPSEGKLKELLLDHQLRYVVSLTFTSLQKEEPYLLDLEEWIQKTSDPSSAFPGGYEKQIPKQWFEEEAVTGKARKRIKSFVNFARLNKEKPTIRFIISCVPDVDNPGISLYLYKEGQLISRDFEPPLKPLPPVLGEIRHDSVQLQQAASDGRASMASCVVEYKILGQEGWARLGTAKGKVRDLLVRDLLPNTSYEFRCALRSKPDIGESSSESKVVKTLPTSPPGRPQSTVVTSSAVRLTWKRPSIIGEGVAVQEYQVKYVEEAAEGCQSGKGGQIRVTAGGSSQCCRVTGLKSETPYRFCVVAVASDGAESAPSEEARIATLSKGDHSCERPTSPRPGAASPGKGRELELRIMLVGRSGRGKSAVRNAILGWEEFKPVPGENMAAGRCQRGQGSWNGQKVSLTDTADAFDSDICSPGSLAEILRCIDLSRPGPHALVLVTAACSFTAEDQAAARRVLAVFGAGCTRHMILLFTQQADSGGRSAEGGLFQPANEALQELIEKCGYRVCTFGPSAAREEQELQVSRLMGQLHRLVDKNRGEPYAGALYAGARLTESELRCLLAPNGRAQRKVLSELKLPQPPVVASCVVAGVVSVIYCFYFLSRVIQ
ncbi:stonustoxin subunit alpha-like isoform X2 [Paroedura picta]